MNKVPPINSIDRISWNRRIVCRFKLQAELTEVCSVNYSSLILWLFKRKTFEDVKPRCLIPVSKEINVDLSDNPVPNKCFLGN